MAGKKSNPMLAAFEAKLEAGYKQRLHTNSEIDIISLLISANNELKAGPGRAPFLLAEYLDVKMEIAQLLVEDAKDDPEILYTKRNLAKRVRAIVGEEKWPEVRELLPLLREYWD